MYFESVGESHCYRNPGTMWGPTQIQKFWGSFLLGFLLDIFNKRGQGVEPIPKVLGYFLGIF